MIMSRFLKVGVARILAASLLSMCGAMTAQAASTYTVQVTPNVDLGNVTSAVTGDTVFRVDPTTGLVTIVSGGATRSSSGASHAVVTIGCTATGVGDCTKNVNVKLGVVGSPTGRARTLSRILIAMGTATLATSPTTPSSPAFAIGPIGANSSKTFFIGADFPIAGDDSGLPTGAAEADFFAWAAEAPTTPSTGDVGRFQARVIRSIALSKGSDLVFGRITKPPTGSGTVTVNAATGVLTATGGAFGLTPPTPTRASFNVTGEGGQAFTVTLPPSFSMTGPAALTVTTTNTAATAPILSSSLGSGGAYAFGVGGSMPVSNTTPDGSYSGSFTVTVAYN